ncbi:arginase family protein [Formosa sp. A9]|uniref:arginase family protein n=1 Tax=Formosa sp. A9 TaxID=3442641 RepID=UPI003EC0398B
MDKLVLFTNSELKERIDKRPLESKFGENVVTLKPSSNIYEDLEALDVEYVLIGFPEDVGVFANSESVGTSNTWETTVNELLNFQNNQFTTPEKLCILGHVDFTKEIEKLQKLDPSSAKHLAKAKKLVSKIDSTVSQLIFEITKAGKKPIIIGGGHNNAYGNIKGSALALNKAINAINLDMYSGFKQDKGRHSGNGFTYAFTEGFLKDYFIFGLQENYTSDVIFKTLKKLKHIDFITYESLEIRQDTSFKKELQNALLATEHRPFGIELACNSIENNGCEQISASGFSVKKARQFVHFFAQQPQAQYLHICDAKPLKGQHPEVGKLIATLITDFIRAHSK